MCRNAHSWHTKLSNSFDHLVSANSLGEENTESLYMCVCSICDIHLKRKWQQAVLVNTSQKNTCSTEGTMRLRALPVPLGADGGRGACVYLCVCVCVAQRGVIATDLNHHTQTDRHIKCLWVPVRHQGYQITPLLSSSLLVSIFLFFTNPPTRSSFPISFSCSFRNKAYSLDHLLLINRVLQEGLNGRGGERHKEDERKNIKESIPKNMGGEGGRL